MVPAVANRVLLARTPTGGDCRPAPSVHTFRQRWRLALRPCLNANAHPDPMSTSEATLSSSASPAMSQVTHPALGSCVAHPVRPMRRRTQREPRLPVPVDASRDSSRSGTARVSRARVEQTVLAARRHLPHRYHAFIWRPLNLAPDSYNTQVGFWSSTDAPLDFYLCSSPERCPGALAPGECPDGYEGALCARCRPGWYTDGILCRECRRSAWEVVLTGAFFLLIAIPCVVIFLVNITIALSPPSRR